MNFKEFFLTKENRDYKKWEDLSRIIDKLHSSGWRRLGSGTKASVYGKIGVSYVIKVYYDDMCYDRFLDYVEQNSDDPYLIKIKKRIRADDYGIVALERLDPITGRYGWEDILAKLLGTVFSTMEVGNYSFDETIEGVRKKYQFKYDRIPDDWKTKEDFRANKRVDYFIESYLPLFKSMYNLKKYLESIESHCQYDTHLGNIMIRPGTKDYVISDPLIE